MKKGFGYLGLPSPGALTCTGFQLTDGLLCVTVKEPEGETGGEHFTFEALSSGDKPNKEVFLRGSGTQASESCVTLFPDLW